MWELIAANRINIENWLKEGYEPFAVTIGDNNLETIWLKREVMSEEEKKLRMEYYTNAIHSEQPKPKQRASRGTTEDPKG